MKGRIFDIRRFSTHDGTGIRTTVFFKGCPLCCVWCQNPEGINAKSLPTYFENKCIHCGTCIIKSVNGGVALNKDGISINKTAQDCWDEIIDACPAGAIAMDSYEYSVDELYDEIIKDKVFFSRGGGVTLSGGEPLMQGSFAKELLKKLHIEGIHTAIETSLFTTIDVLEQVLPYLDQIYADFKIFDSAKHKEYTGVPNEKIKENLKYLLASPKKDSVIIRTPLIPKFTAYEENIADIARFLSDIYPDVKYELLNYNPLAKAKYHLVDREYCFEENPKQYSALQMKEFCDIANNNGINNLIVEK